MQIKVNFLCKDSILAAPLVLDLVRLVDVAKRHGEAGIQRQLSVFFKAPYHAEGERPMHDLFKQYALLEQWAHKINAAVHAATEARPNGTNGANGTNGHKPSTDKPRTSDRAAL
jgi:hypothetical protein